MLKDFNLCNYTLTFLRANEEDERVVRKRKGPEDKYLSKRRRHFEGARNCFSFVFFVLHTALEAYTPVAGLIIFQFNCSHFYRQSYLVIYQFYFRYFLHTVPFELCHDHK